MADVRRGDDGAPAHPRMVLATCILASSLAFIDGSVLNVALPAIGRSYQAATAELQWVINGFLLPLSALLLIGGAAGDHYGRRRLLVGGILLFCAASLLCAAAPGLEILLAGRALQGLGAAMLLPNSLAVLSAAFSGARRGAAVGTWAAAGAISAAAAPLLGGWLVDTVGWPAIFLINLPFGLGAVWLALRYVPESRLTRRTPPDWPGAVVATIALGALTWGLTAWTASASTGAAVLPALIVGIAASLLFLALERRRGSEAMVPLGLFGSRPFVGLTLMTFLLYGALSGLLVLLPFTLIEGLGYSAVAAGTALLPLPILIAAGSPFMGRLAARIGPRLPLTFGPMIVAAGFLLGLRIEAQASYWTSVLPSLALIAAGMAASAAPLTAAVLGAVDGGHAGTASGLNSAVSRTGGLIATALIGTVLARQDGALVQGYHDAAIVGAALAAAAGLCALATLGGQAPERIAAPNR